MADPDATSLGGRRNIPRPIRGEARCVSTGHTHQSHSSKHAHAKTGAEPSPAQIAPGARRGTERQRQPQLPCKTSHEVFVVPHATWTGKKVCSNFKGAPMVYLAIAPENAVCEAALTGANHENTQHPPNHGSPRNSWTSGYVNARQARAGRRQSLDAPVRQQKAACYLRDRNRVSGSGSRDWRPKLGRIRNTAPAAFGTRQLPPILPWGAVHHVVPGFGVQAGRSMRRGAPVRRGGSTRGRVLFRGNLIFRAGGIRFRRFPPRATQPRMGRCQNTRALHRLPIPLY